MTDTVVPGPWSLRWRGFSLSVPALFFLIGAALLAVPTLQGIARTSWSTEQGAHGPIVLAIAVWLIARQWPVMLEHAAPPRGFIGWLALGAMLCGYAVARIVGSIVLESAALYGALLSALYLFVGVRALRASWFPLAYLIFVLPPPGSWVAAATQPLRLQISELAVGLLSAFGMPVARAGLLIYVDQYILEVKAACGGLNSMISLSAIGLFYVYMRHNANVRYTLLMAFVIVAMALVANFARVLILIVITYTMGDRAAQGFLHDFSGMTMFLVAMGGIILFDAAASPIRRWVDRRAST